MCVALHLKLVHFMHFVMYLLKSFKRRLKVLDGGHKGVYPNEKKIHPLYTVYNSPIKKIHKLKLCCLCLGQAVKDLQRLVH